MLSLSRQIFLVDIAKTGSTSLRRALHPVLDTGAIPPARHRTAREVAALLGPELWGEFRTAAVIRHPVDRAVSSYFYRQQYKHPGGRDHFGGRGFSDWIEWMQEHQRDNPEWMPQSDYLADSEGRRLVDHLHSYQDLAAVWQQIRGWPELAGDALPDTLPHEHKTERPPWGEVASGADIARLQEIFPRDFALHLEVTA